MVTACARMLYAQQILAKDIRIRCRRQPDSKKSDRAACNLTYNIFNLTRTINEADTRYDITYYPNQSRAMTTKQYGNITTAQRVI